MSKKTNIEQLFFEEPTREFNVREIARILRISPATASKKLQESEKEGILIKRDERMLKLYKANLDEEKYKDLKIYYNIRKIKESGLIEALNKFYLKPIIIFFGSGTSGLDTETSDFDFLVVSEKTTEFKETKMFEKKLKREIQLFVVSDIKELKNERLINNILNGINIQGKLRWI